MNKLMNRLTAIALGSLAAVALSGCARNAVEPAQRTVEVAPPVQPAPMAEVVTAAPATPVAPPVERPVASSNPSATTGGEVMSTPSQSGMGRERSSDTFGSSLPARVDRN
jgi:hypothetical protein